MSSSLDNLGLVTYQQGDYAQAEVVFKESLALYREIGNKQGIAYPLMHLGEMALNQGDYAQARALLKESLEIGREIGDKKGIAYSLNYLATLAAEQGHSERAAGLWASADALREAIGSPLSPNEKEEGDRKVAAARTSLGEQAFSTAWKKGRAMTIEQAIAYALEED